MAQTKKADVSAYLIHLLFFLYFVILAAERLQSLIRSFADPAVHAWGDGFNGYVYTLTILSLVAAVVYLLVRCRALFCAPFTRNAALHEQIDRGALCVAAGIILLAGMVHTEYTIAPVQFAAYGALILAMIIQTAIKQKSSSRPYLLWLSLVYLTLFSMAIPVMYRSHIRLSALFHVLEAIAAVVLVLIFTRMMHLVFTGDATDLFGVPPILTAAILDGVLLGLRWQEEVNAFVLIFIIAACVCWCIGGLIALRAPKGGDK